MKKASPCPGSHVSSRSRSYKPSSTSALGAEVASAEQRRSSLFYAFWPEKDGAMTFSFTILSKIFHFNHLRTLILTNVPVKIHSEKELKEYFKYRLSRSFATPLVGLSSSSHRRNPVYRSPSFLILETSSTCLYLPASLPRTGSESILIIDRVLIATNRRVSEQTRTSLLRRLITASLPVERHFRMFICAAESSNIEGGGSRGLRNDWLFTQQSRNKGRLASKVHLFSDVLMSMTTSSSLTSKCHGLQVSPVIYSPPTNATSI